MISPFGYLYSASKALNNFAMKPAIFILLLGKQLWKALLKGDIFHDDLVAMYALVALQFGSYLWVDEKSIFTFRTAFLMLEWWPST